MGDFDSFFEQDNTLGGSDIVWRDADTLARPDGTGLRIEGLEAPEIAKVFGGNLPKAGEAGGWAWTKAVRDLANSQGFTNVVPVLDENGNPKMSRDGSRELVRLTDSSGRDFTQELLNQGIAPSGEFNTPEEVAASEAARAFRINPDAPQTEWDLARQQIANATEAEETRVKQFKTTALNEAFLATGSKLYSPGAVQMRRTDRDLNNKALNPLAEAWDIGITGVQESLWGVLEMTGTTTDWDWAQQMGDEGIGRARASLADSPILKLSALDEEGNWDIDGVGEFFEYLGNNAVISMPYMAATIGGTLAAPLTGGLSLSAPVAIYTGQTWNEMEGEKNAGIAIAAGVTQAALDRLGIKGITGSILKKETRDAAINQLIKNSGGNLTKKQASDMLANATRKEIGTLAGSLGAVAKQQLDARNVARQMMKSATLSGLAEAGTEAAQESVGYGASIIGSDKTWDANEYTNRVANALLAGGTLGASFAAPTTLYDTGAWADIAVRQAPADARRAADSARWARDETNKFGRVKSVQELTTELDQETAARGDAATHWQDRIKAHKADKRRRTVFEAGQDLWGAVPGLWRGAVRHILPQELQNQSRALRKMADMFNGNLQRTFSGAHFENRKHHLLTEYKNGVPDPVQIADNLGIKSFRKRGGRAEINRVLTRLGDVVKASEADGTIDWDNLPADIAEYRQFLSAYYDAYKTLGDKMYADQKKYNKELGYINNYLFHYKSFNKANIEKNQNGFIDALVQKGVPREEAIAITDEILNSDNINGQGDFHVGHGRQIPGSHRARTLNLADDVNFNEFMENDFLNNVSNAAKSAARYVAYQEFIGDDNAKLAELLQQAEDEGVPKARLNKIAAMMQDYLDAESGNYKRIKNPHWNKIQQNLLFWTSMAGLPLATISSFVELALTTRALTKDQIFKTIGGAAKQGAQSIWGAMKEFDNETNRAKAKNNRQSDLEDLGYFNWEVGAAHTTGVTQAGHSKQKWLEMYFRAIGLQQWTDFTRQVRASMAGDYIGERLDIINNQRNNNDTYTNEVQEAEEQLRNIGINIDDMLTIMNATGELSPEEQRVMADNMREGMFNFINEAVALPQAGNRPLFYQNPHLALFTQFQGFISTFTANHIPKMWNELVARGTPAMKYNAFALMSTMIALGFVSQHLKDLLKYGQPSPYLDDAEKFQRAIGASGLLGTGERVLNLFNPIYEQQSEGPVDWVFDTIFGESAAISNIQRGAKGIAQLPVDPQQGTYNILKTTPFTGPFNMGNRWIADTLFGGG